VSASLVYRSPLLYELVMIALYGRHYASRYRSIAQLIPNGACVLDLCCGPGFLYERCLERKSVEYLGLDVNPRFVGRVQRLGAQAQLWDLHTDAPLPSADYVIMQASLYQFLPDVAPIVGRMRQAARRAVIIAEPIRNLSTSRIAMLAAIAGRQTDAGLGVRAQRFTEATLDSLLASPPAQSSQAFLIPGGREKVYVFDPPHSPGERL
jgi:SAM-dependent methyltransferase